MSSPSHDFATFVLPWANLLPPIMGVWNQAGGHSETAAQAQGLGSAGWCLEHWECPGHPFGGGFSWLISSQTMESIRDLSAVLNGMSRTRFQVQIKPMEFHKADWQAASHCG